MAINAKNIFVRYAHADSVKMLKGVSHLKKFIAHGEQDASQALKSQVKQRFHRKYEISCNLD